MHMLFGLATEARWNVGERAEEYLSSCYYNNRSPLLLFVREKGLPLAKPPPRKAMADQTFLVALSLLTSDGREYWSLLYSESEFATHHRDSIS